MGENSKFPKSWTLENQNLKLAVCLQIIKNSKFNGQIPFDKLKVNQNWRNQHFEADFLWKVSLKILNSRIILKTFTHDKVISYLFLYQRFNHHHYNYLLSLSLPTILMSNINISYLSVQQSNLSPRGAVDDLMALLHEAEGQGQQCTSSSTALMML